MTDFGLDQAIIEPANDAPEDEAPTRTRKPRSDKGKPRSTGGRPSRASSLKKLADDLLEPWAMLAAGASMTMPTLAGVMISRGERTADAIVKIAEKHPRMLKALQKGAEMSAFSELAQTGLQMVIAAGMDFGRIPPDSPMGMMTGVSDIYAQTHPPMPDDVQTNGYPPNLVPFPGMPGMPVT